MRHVPTRAALVLASLLTVSLAGCDHGSALVIQNDMDERLIARVTGRAFTEASAPSPVYRTVDVAAHTRVILAVLPFAGGPQYTGLELLHNCTPMVTFHTLSGGNLFVVSDQWRVQQGTDGAEDTVAAPPTTECPLPDASPIP